MVNAVYGFYMAAIGWGNTTIVWCSVLAWFLASHRVNLLLHWIVDPVGADVALAPGATTVDYAEAIGTRDRIRLFEGVGKCPHR